MNKNILIGVVVTALVLVLGYAAFRNNSIENAGLNMQDASSTVNTSSNTSTNTNSNNTPPATTSTNPRAITAPSVQTNIQVTISNSTALVSGKITPNGAQTAYWYEYGLNTSVTSRTSKQNIGSGYTAITAPANIVSLRANTPYYFRLVAENSAGTTRGEVRSFTTNSTPVTSGTAPTIQTTSATSVVRSGATLTGKVTPNSAVTTWWFEYGENTSLGNLTTFETINAGQVSTSVTSAVSGLKPLTKYYFRINAQNQFGTMNGSVSSFTTAGPINSEAPIVKTNNPTNISTSSVTMNGRLDPNDSNTTYWFEYSDESFVGGIIGTMTATQTMNGADTAIGVKVDVVGLRKNTKYFYRMVARNEYGTVAGGTVSFRTK